ncbi:amidohydrolase family protein [Microbacterium sp. USTB-Y]|uniref:amidohydrolase family protein n=1 Tax=Microbacterium sp. USTB-Y TaxID=2823692 RepID=UPI0020401552|nr:amidohydrolase family protein [Microbacterium sp. USTB-Y]
MKGHGEVHHTSTTLARRIRCAQGLEPADLIVRNCELVDVNLQETRPADIAIIDGTIVAVRPEFDGLANVELDARGQFATPGLVQTATAAFPPGGLSAGDAAISRVWAHEPQRAPDSPVEDVPEELHALAGSPLTIFLTGRAQSEDVLDVLRQGRIPVITDLVEEESMLALFRSLGDSRIDTRNVCISAVDVPVRTVVSAAGSMGVPPLEAIQMATLNPAMCLGVDHHVGSITPGRYADITITPTLVPTSPAVMIRRGAVTWKA